MSSSCLGVLYCECLLIGCHTIYHARRPLVCRRLGFPAYWLFRRIFNFMLSLARCEVKSVGWLPHQAFFLLTIGLADNTLGKSSTYKNFEETDLPTIAASVLFSRPPLPVRNSPTPVFKPIGSPARSPSCHHNVPKTSLTRNIRIHAIHEHAQSNHVFRGQASTSHAANT